MWNFNRLDLSNYVLFDKATIDLDYKGLTVINGRNKDARTSSGNANFTGKSLLVSAIPNIIYGLSKPTVTVKTKAKKDAFYREGSSAVLNMTVGEDIFEIEKYLKGKSNLTMKVSKNEADMGYTKSSSVLSWLNEVVPVSEDMFFSTMYLDSGRPNLSLSGSGATRFKFFSDAFDLDVYDDMKDDFVAAKSALEKDRIRLDEQESRLLDIENEMKSLRKIIVKHSNSWETKTASIIEDTKEKAFAVTRALPLLEESTSRVDFDKNRLKKVKKQLSSVESNILEIKRYRQQEKAENKNNRLRDKYQRLLEKLEKPKKSISKLQRQLESLKEINASISHYDSEIENLKRDLKQYDYNRKIKNDSNLEAMKDERSDVRNTIQRLESLDKGVCPTCGSKVDSSKTIKKMLIDLKKRKSNLDTAITQVEKHRQIKSDYENTEKQLKISEKKRASFPKKVESTKNLKTQIRNAKSFEDLSRKLSSLPKKTKLKSINLKDTSELRKTRQNLSQELEKLLNARSASRVISNLRSLGFKSPEEVHVMKKKIDKVDLNELTSLLAERRNAVSSNERLEEEKKKTILRISQLEKNLKRMKALDALVLAYGNKGLKRYAAASLAHQVETNLNELAPLIFEGGLKFVLDVTPTDFHIMFEDKRGLFDVRNLSGAQSRLFTVLSMLGILPMLPANRRSNILVLDEMNTNLDASSSDKFCNALIPALTDIIPHVLVVSPLEDVYPDSRRIVVEKSNDTSSLQFE